MSAQDPSGVDSIEASTRRWLALSLSGVFVITVFFVFATLWWFDAESKDALAVLSAVIGVLGAVTGYYFATGDS
jgi:hypothetical protein